MPSSECMNNLRVQEYQIEMERSKSVGRVVVEVILLGWNTRGHSERER